MVATDLLLGLDGGQTATKALLADRDGRILATGRGGPADHLHAAGGEAKNRTAIHGKIDAVLGAAGAGREAVSVVALGWTGAVASSLQIPLVERIVREKLAPRQVVVAPDYVTNLAGASKSAFQNPSRDTSRVRDAGVAAGVTPPRCQDGSVARSRSIIRLGSDTFGR